MFRYYEAPPNCNLINQRKNVSHLKAIYGKCSAVCRQERARHISREKTLASMGRLRGVVVSRPFQESTGMGSNYYLAL